MSIQFSTKVFNFVNEHLSTFFKACELLQYYLQVLLSYDNIIVGVNMTTTEALADFYTMIGYRTVSALRGEIARIDTPKWRYYLSECYDGRIKDRDEYIYMRLFSKDRALIYMSMRPLIPTAYSHPVGYIPKMIGLQAWRKKHIFDDLYEDWETSFLKKKIAELNTNGAIIRAYRLKKKISIVELSAILEISPNTLSSIEKNIYRPGYRLGQEIAEYLNFDFKKLSIARPYF
jgi:DNA-binding XRE family transcriptional regulator